MLPPGATLVFLRWGLCLGLLALAVFGLRQWGYAACAGDMAKVEAELKQERRDHGATKGYYARILKEAAERAQAVAARAATASATVKAAQAANNARLQEALNEAQNARDTLLADLRDGVVQLLPRWTCAGGTTAGAGEGGTAADAAAAYAASRHDSAARIVAAGDADAALIDRLWSGWQADRTAVIAAGCAVEVQP